MVMVVAAALAANKAVLNVEAGKVVARKLQEAQAEGNFLAGKQEQEIKKMTGRHKFAGMQVIQCDEARSMSDGKSKNLFASKCDEVK